MQYQVVRDEEKHLIICCVLLGNVERVDLECYQTRPSNTGYDTGSDDPKNPKWYVVWANDINKRILPIYVGSCKTFVVAAGNCNISYLSFMNFLCVLYKTMCFIF